MVHLTPWPLQMPSLDHLGSGRREANVRGDLYPHGSLTTLVGMSDSAWMVLVAVTGGVLAILGRQWYRRRVAAKLADKLLADVVKGKDGFRR